MFRNLIIKLLIIIGIPKFFRFFYQRRQITIICYHDIVPDCFEKQVKYILKKYNVIDLALLEKIILNRSEKMPKNALLITFDDGHIGNFKLLDIFKAYKIRPIIFLTSKIIGSLAPFWFKLPFDNNNEKERIKLLPDSERRNYIETKYKKINHLAIPQALSIEMIKNMLPYVDFQSHTIDHPCLPNCTSKEAKFQIEQSKTKIEKITGRQVYAIAYPNGDYSDRDIQLSGNFGYRLGFTAKKGFVTLKTAPLELPRLSINDTCNFDEFILRLTGLWSKIRKLKFS